MTARGLALLFLLALAVHGPAAASGAGAGSEDCRPVYVVDHGYHVGIVVAAAAFAPESIFGPEAFAATPWLQFGWGDAAFYRDPEAGLGLGLRALFLPTDAVMHVRGLAATPDRAFAGAVVRRFDLTPTGHARLMARLRETLVRQADGRAVEVDPRHGPASRFYRAGGTYSMFYTCNNYAADLLVAGGVPIDPADTAHATELMAKVRAVTVMPCTRNAPR